MIDKVFGQTLRRLREERGMSQEDLGHEADLHFTTISRLERGITSPTLKTLHKLAVVLNIRISELMVFMEQELEENSSAN
jgi:transcriptional regulator with XRE-family HTH domain